MYTYKILFAWHQSFARTKIWQTKRTQKNTPGENIITSLSRVYRLLYLAFNIVTSETSLVNFTQLTYGDYVLEEGPNRQYYMNEHKHLHNKDLVNAKIQKQWNNTKSKYHELFFTKSIM